MGCGLGVQGLGASGLGFKGSWLQGTTDRVMVIEPDGNREAMGRRKPSTLSRMPKTQIKSRSSKP